jgi:hypothetical protein
MLLMDEFLTEAERMAANMEANVHPAMKIQELEGEIRTLRNTIRILEDRLVHVQQVHDASMTRLVAAIEAEMETQMSDYPVDRFSVMTIRTMLEHTKTRVLGAQEPTMNETGAHDAWKARLVAWLDEQESDAERKLCESTGIYAWGWRGFRDAMRYAKETVTSGRIEIAGHDE